MSSKRWWPCTLVALAVLVGSVLPTSARVISYAPVTTRPAVPAVQPRSSRHYALIEIDQVYTISYSAPLALGALVVYDSKGEQSPRTVLRDQFIMDAALWEGDDEVPVILVTVVDWDHLSFDTRLSSDGGATWQEVKLDSGYVPSNEGVLFSGVVDRGGPVVRGRNGWVLPGSYETPFYCLIQSSTSYERWRVVGITREGRTQLRGGLPDRTAEGSIIAAPRLLSLDTPTGNLLLSYSENIGTLKLTVETVLLFDDGPAPVTVVRPHRLDLQTAWYAGKDKFYLHLGPSSSGPEGLASGEQLVFVQGGAFRTVARAVAAGSLVAVPHANGGGAWIAAVGGADGTQLMSHKPGGALTTLWTDATAPRIEALHAANSGTRLLVQVNRLRPMVTTTTFKDPALGIWDVGSPTPPRYDELFVNEAPTKGFVQLDVDAVAGGGGFVFDAGVVVRSGGGPAGFPSYGVVQEWGVIRASLAERQVVPGIGRTTGKLGSRWATELTLASSGTEPFDVTLRFVPNGESGPTLAREAKVTLTSQAIRWFADPLKDLLGVESGAGALFVTPELGHSVGALAEVKNVGGTRTTGTMVPGVDTLAAVSERFPATFSAAVPGWGARTNLVLANAEAGPSAVTGEPLGVFDGWWGWLPVALAVAAPPGGQTQLNDISRFLGLMPWEVAGLVLRPTNGSTVPALFVIDNATNDSTFFGPDLIVSRGQGGTRTIPIVQHATDGSGALWVSDLYLLNVSSRTEGAWLTTVVTNKSATFVLAPGETRVVRDVLRIFGVTGADMLRVSATSSSDSADPIRFTSRSYKVVENRGTIGCAVPPMNSFSLVTTGEVIELVGPRGDALLSTDLTILETTAPQNLPSTALVEVFDEVGAKRDQFTVTLAARLQTVPDLFRTRGLPNGPIRLRISPAIGPVARPTTQGLFAAVATVHDLTSGDRTVYYGGLAPK